MILWAGEKKKISILELFVTLAVHHPFRLDLSLIQVPWSKICFCSKGPGEGPICLFLLFSSDPSNIFIMYFAVHWFSFDSKWLNSTPTVHIFVAGIRCFKVLFNQSS